MELAFLGAVVVRRPGVPGPLLVRFGTRSLALLAVLALMEPRGLHRRDKLTGLLWPELDELRARGALRQALLVLRRSLGQGLLLAGGHEEVGLRLEGVSCDVSRFLQAAASGANAEAVELFRGPLLDGVHVPDAPEFMDWLDRLRDRLARVHFRCIERLGLEHERVGRWQDALEWWSRLAAADPLHLGTASAQVRCLAALGDVAGALRRAEACARQVREETGVNAAPRLQEAFADGCRLAISPGSPLGRRDLKHLKGKG